MVGFRGIETGQRNYLGDDRLGKGVLLIELRDIVVGHLLLRFVLIPNRRPILSSGVRTLSIQLGRVVRDEEKHLQQIVVRNFGRIVGNLHRFGVAGLAGADDFILRGVGRASGVSRDNLGYAFDV